jgi:hypothetical protein
MALASTMKALLTKTFKLPALFMLLKAPLQHFKPPLPNNQLLSQLRLTPLSSNHTHQECLTALLVEPLLTTQSSLLAMVQKTDKITGSLRTHGVPHGVKTDTSRSPLSKVTVFAVFNLLQSTHPLLEEYFSSNLIQNIVVLF